MNETKCVTCGKEIILPQGVNPNYAEIGNIDVCSFVLPERTYGMEDTKLMEHRNQLAHCDPLHGGYYCFDCYGKAKLEEEKKARQE